MNCKNCEHWEQEEYSKDRGYCESGKVRKDLREYIKTSAEFGCIHFQEQENKACQHEKVYDKELLMSDPPKQKWTCSKCGEQGIDIVVYGSLTSADEYTKRIFTSQSELTLGDGEISLRVSEEDYDELKDSVEENKAATTIQVGEIEQGVIKDYSITTDKFKSLLEKVRAYESRIEVASDEIPVKYDGTEF